MVHQQLWSFSVKTPYHFKFCFIINSLNVNNQCQESLQSFHSNLLLPSRDLAPSCCVDYKPLFRLSKYFGCVRISEVSNLLQKPNTH